MAAQLPATELTPVIDESLIERMPEDLRERLQKVFEEYRAEDVNRPG
jgi:hypothetical protein